jgi:DNA replication protein DnaC
MHSLQIAKVGGSYMKELGRLAKTDVLILDDLGLSPNRGSRAARFA